MDEDTTPEAPAETGTDQVHPEQAPEAEAVDNTQDAPNEETVANDEPSEPADNSGYDEDTLKWFEARGIDPSAPDAVQKLAKSAREAEKKMHETTSKASELEKSINTQADDIAEQTGKDPDVVRLIVKDKVRDFFDQNPAARQMESDMVKELSQRPHLAGDLEALYAVVKSRTDNSESLRSEGSRQALETLASKQRTSAPSGAAVNPAVSAKPTITRSLINQKMQAGDYAWLDKNDSEINRLAAEGRLQ